MRLAHLGKPTKWPCLPEADIVQRLLYTDATTRGIAAEIGCSDSTIKMILRKHTTKEARLDAKRRKQAARLEGFKQHAGFGEQVRTRVSGTKNPFYGRKHAESFKAAQAARKKGVSLSEKHRIAVSAALQGISVEVWREYITPKNERARNSLQYAVWRAAVYQRDGYTCQMCGRRGGRLHPHHIVRFARNTELRYSVDNGVTLCAEPCHRLTINHEEEYEQRFKRVIQAKTEANQSVGHYGSPAGGGGTEGHAQRWV